MRKNEHHETHYHQSFLLFPGWFSHCWSFQGLFLADGGERTILGGGLVPIAEAGGGLWDYVWTLPGPDGSLMPSDPAALLFALLGSLTWWNPNASLVGLFVLAIPLAGAIAWWGFSQLFSKAWTTTAASFVWALSPPLLLALADGRVGAVLALLALPWLLGTLITAHESWQRVGQASLASIVVTSSAPALWPIVLISAVVVALSRAVSHPIRMLVGVVPIVLGPFSSSFTSEVSWLVGSGVGSMVGELGCALRGPRYCGSIRFGSVVDVPCGLAGELSPRPWAMFWQ